MRNSLLAALDPATAAGYIGAGCRNIETTSTLRLSGDWLTFCFCLNSVNCLRLPNSIKIDAQRGNCINVSRTLS